jgi:hypothetical protein
LLGLNGRTHRNGQVHGLAVNNLDKGKVIEGGEVVCFEINAVHRFGTGDGENEE